MGGSVAVLSDIHGNIRALEAVLSDVQRRGIEQVVQLGDALYGPFDPRPVADQLLSAGWRSVAGNEDRCLTSAFESSSESPTARFTKRWLSHEHLGLLASWPSILTWDGATAFHGSAGDDTRYFLTRLTVNERTEPIPAAELRASLPNTDSRLILCGHDHLPRVVRLSEGPLIVNPGSVGCPAYTDDHPVSHRVENGSPHARYAVIHSWDGDMEAELVSVEYPWEDAAREAEENGFPNWGTWIRTGRA